MPKVGILGATGYTGLELIKTLHKHPQLEIGFLGSISSAGKKVKEVFPFLEGFDIGEYTFGDYESIPRDVELLFLALPHEVSMELVPKLLKDGFKIVDLSGAYRFKKLEDYKTFYGFEHKYPHVLEQGVYGLPELFREYIKTAYVVANPGCYPTATLLALYPLLTGGRDYIKDNTVIVHALSGVSGAGRSPKQQFHFPEMTNDMFSYKVLNHRHIPEMEYVSRVLSGSEIRIRFTPTVVPIDRGMVSTIYVKSEKFDILELYREVYKDETFIRIVEQPPHSKWVSNTNYCYIYPTYDERTETAVIISAIDNLVKGASGQAVQNANLMLGLDEDSGLTEPLPGIV